MPAIEILDTPEALAQAAARRLGALARQAVAARGRFTIALTGGRTPKALYGLLAHAPAEGPYPWEAVQVCFGDERCVPADHPDSNFRMAHDALLGKIPIPIENIHRMPGELPPSLGAEEYEQTLHRLFPGQALPDFDVILLGLGDDGHTASLFPGSPALDETRRWVAAVVHAAPPEPLVDRISLTLPVLNAAREVIFLVSGAAKQAIAARVLFDRAAQPLPAQRVQPVSGRLTWMLDKAAAGQG